MRRYSLLVFSVLTLGALSFQQPIRIEVRNVHLPLMAFENSKAVQLSKENLRVFEGEKDQNGKVNWTEQEIQNLSRYEDQGIALAVANDSSESMAPAFNNGFLLQKDKIEQARNASRTLFKSVFRKEKDKGLVSEIFCEITYINPDLLKKELGYMPNNANPSFFYKNVYCRYWTTRTFTVATGQSKVISTRKWALVTTSLFINQDWTEDIKKIEIGISDINKGRGITPLRDGIFNIAKHFSKAEGNLFRVAVVLTDGLDSEDPKKPGEFSSSRHTLKETIAELQNNQVLVYAVGLYDRTAFSPFVQQPAKATDFLEELAQATGGLAFFESDLSRLTGIFQSIGAMIRNVNYLSYTPKSAQEGERQIRVEAGEWDAGHKWHQKRYNLFYRKGYTYKK